ncbi:MAG TPA: CARDB domain-containing protein, partial [Thermoanaerobaculia bacterium]|nr:CARDB domain-containing protein [Thermoanaerobaculia bacterium]
YASTYRSTSATQTDLIPAPGVASAGQSVTFQSTIGNRGTGTVNPLRVEYYLSTDRFIDRNDTFLGAATFSLGSGFAGTHSTTVTIPSNQPAGTYYFGWIVDPLGSISEVNESNNAVALAASTFVSASACGEASCVPVQGTYISHFTGAGCTGTESYYLPYDSFGYSCRTWNGTGQCGTIQRTVTNRSYRHNGTCFDAWPSGNTLSQFVTIYR